MLKIKALLQYITDIIGNVFTKKQLVLISEGFDWVIHEECLVIKEYLESRKLVSVRISTTPIGLKNKMVHFLSENTLIGKNGLKHKKGSNHFILSWFHISDADQYRTKHISLLNQGVDFVHTAAQITEDKLVQHGMNSEKIIRIGLDVNLKLFHPIDSNKKVALLNKLGLPTDKILVGSFQKDGNGWGEGLEPKLIKGPDIFCDVIQNIAKDYPIHVVLTGPARGYVKNRLSLAGIPYTHVYLKKYTEVAEYFQSIDLYLITSREEGGPKALLESMATGIPLISTAVGMVPDVIEDGINGFITETNNTPLLIQKTRDLLKNKALEKTIVDNALRKISEYSSEKMVEQFYNKIYKNFINR